MRKFKVLLKNRGKWLAYKDLTGKQALDLMQSLLERGFRSTAYTKANGITEVLTLTEMQEVII